MAGKKCNHFFPAFYWVMVMKVYVSPYLVRIRRLLQAQPKNLAARQQRNFFFVFHQYFSIYALEAEKTIHSFRF
jgi:hypothetical protein